MIKRNTFFDFNVLLVFTSNFTRSFMIWSQNDRRIKGRNMNERYENIYNKKYSERIMIRKKTKRKGKNIKIEAGIKNMNEKLIFFEIL